MPKIILGPPGTGKTTTLLNLIDQYLVKGIPPNKLCFISFTKKATEEARDRAKVRFGLKTEDLEYFRTIHSLAFKMVGANTASVMKFRDYKAFGEYLGIEIKGRFNVEDGMLQQLERGDKLLFIEQLSRVRCVPLEKAWEDAGEDDVPLEELKQVSEALRRWKQVNLKIDYTDMLERYLDEEYVPEFKVLFVDEAQDLSQLQWRIVHRLMDKAEEVYIAGDDDQAIFRWSGADVDHFVSLSGEVTVLDHSFRLPEAIRKLSEACTDRIDNRRKKRYNSNGLNGYVYYSNSVDELNLSKGQWLLLVRNGYMVKKLEDHCKNRGIFYAFRDKGLDFFEPLLAARYWQRLIKPHEISSDEYVLLKNFLPFKPRYAKERTSFSVEDVPETLRKTPWHEALKITDADKELIRSLLRNGEKLQEPPRVRISTIHGAKGGEAENVALFTDISYKTYEAMQRFPDDEARTFYVGITRAKESLYVMSPETTRYFEL